MTTTAVSTPAPTAPSAFPASAAPDSEQAPAPVSLRAHDRTQAPAGGLRIVVALVRSTLLGFVREPVGFVMQFLVGIKAGWLPVTAGSSPGVTDLLMPAIVLSAVSFAYVLRLTRTEVSENLGADHVRTARAKGLGRTRVATHHVLRNSLIPVVTFLGADLGALMGGAIVTEGIFNIHGVGGTLYKAITQGQGSTVVSFTTVLILVFIVSNLLVDLLYAALDPRIRYA